MHTQIETVPQQGSQHHHQNDLNTKMPYRYGKIRFLVLFLLAMAVFGNQYAFNNPQALQESIIKELGISQPQYDMLYTIFALPNIFATFIIGFLIDFLGVRIGIVTLSLGVALFQAVVAIAGVVKSYPCMLLGRMLFGIASQSLITAQASFVSFWFVGKELAFALGLAITIPQLGNAFNSFLTPIIFQQTRTLGTPLFASVGICGVSFICALVVAYLDKKADKEDQIRNVRVVEVQEKEIQSQQIKCSDLKMLKGSFWLIVILCMFSVAMYVTFLDNANQLLQIRFCYSQTSAGRAVMITYIVASLCSAPLGMLVDKIGLKRYFIIGGMATFTVAHLIILLYPQCPSQIFQASSSSPSWGLFLIGVGYCFYANCVVPSIPLVVKKKVTGTAFGIMQMIESIALTFFPLIEGELIEHANNEKVGYRHSSIFFIVIGFISIAASLGLLFISKQTKRKLDATSKQKLMKEVKKHCDVSHCEQFEQKQQNHPIQPPPQIQIQQSAFERKETKHLIDSKSKQSLDPQL